MTLPVAGWYDDPADAQLLRWWTGTEWSDARERRQPHAPVTEPVADPVGEPVAEPVAEVATGPATEPEAPLPYGPASVSGATAAPASVSAASVSDAPTGPPPLPPFALGDHTGGEAAIRAAEIPVPLPSPAAVAAPSPSTFAQLRKGNPLAFTGVLVGLAALVFNPLGGPGLLALIFGIMGMVRAGDLKRRGATVTGVGWAIAALVLAGIVIIRAFANLFGMAV
jgi:hypothetical protein